MVKTHWALPCSLARFAATSAITVAASRPYAREQLIFSYSSLTHLPLLCPPFACSINPSTTTLYTYTPAHIPRATRWPDCILFARPHRSRSRSYEALHGGDIADALVDLTGGSALRIEFKDDAVQSMIDDGSMWERIKRYFDWYYLITCVKVAEDFEDEESQGILQGHLYSVVGVKEIGTIKFLKIRNPWGKGEWSGEWSSGSSKWDEHQEVEQAMRADPDIAFNRDANDGEFWMILEDFVRLFDTMHVCRLFGEDFNQYMIRGEWKGKTAGGAHPALVNSQKARGKGAGGRGRGGDGGEGKQDGPTAKPVRYGTVLGGRMPDGDPRWFNNPQYLITVTEPSECYFSLLQRDKRFVGSSANVPINMVLLRQRASDRSRVWEPHPAALVANAADAKLPGGPWPPVGREPPREVGMSSVVLDPAWSYVLVPHTSAWGVDHEFTCRIFSRSELDVTALPETHCKVFEGEWRYSKSRDTTGGPLRLPLSQSSSSSGAKVESKLDDPSAVGGVGGAADAGRAASAVKQKVLTRANPKWCQNPQYLLRVPPGRRTKTTLKVILKRTDTKGWDKKKKCRTGKHNEIGIVVCKLSAPPSTSQQRRKARSAHLREEGEEGDEGALDVSMSSMTKGSGDEETNLENEITPKLEIPSAEWRQISEYSGTEEATTLVDRISASWADPGLILVPSTDLIGLEGHFSLQVFSDQPVNVTEMQDTHQQTIAGEWKEGANGGSHLHPEWRRNPRFTLRIMGRARGDRPANVKITLTRPEAAWRRQCGKDSVGAMMGFYLLPGTAVDREDPTNAATHDGASRIIDWHLFGPAVMHRTVLCRIVGAAMLYRLVSLVRVAI